MSVYKRGNIWHYDFWLRGRRYRGSTKQNQENRARKMEAMLMAELKSRGISSLFAAPRRLDQTSGRFLQWVEQALLEGKSKLYYRNGWRMLRATDLAKMRIDEIQNGDIELVKFSGGAANRNNALRTLRRMLGKAKEWGLLGNVPTVKLAKEARRERIYDTKLEDQVLANAMKTSVDCHDLFLLTVDAGLRPWREAARLAWPHCNMLERVIQIVDSKTPAGRRLVPMTDRVFAMLLRRGPKAGGYVFPSSRSKSGHITTTKTAWNRLRKELNLPDGLVLYSARHTFGTRVLKRSGDLAAVMKVMGHEQVSTTMRYQVPQLDDDFRAAMERKVM
jgi:integrase